MSWSNSSSKPKTPPQTTLGWIKKLLPSSWVSETKEAPRPSPNQGQSSGRSGWSAIMDEGNFLNSLPAEILPVRLDEAVNSHIDDNGNGNGNGEDAPVTVVETDAPIDAVDTELPPGDQASLKEDGKQEIDTKEVASARKQFGGEDNNETTPVESLVSTLAKGISSNRNATPYKASEDKAHISSAFALSGLNELMECYDSDSDWNENKTWPDKRNEAKESEGEENTKNSDAKKALRKEKMIEKIMVENVLDGDEDSIGFENDPPNQPAEKQHSGQRRQQRVKHSLPLQKKPRLKFTIPKNANANANANTVYSTKRINIVVDGAVVFSNLPVTVKQRSTEIKRKTNRLKADPPAALPVITTANTAYSTKPNKRLKANPPAALPVITTTTHSDETGRKLFKPRKARSFFWKYCKLVGDDKDGDWENAKSGVNFYCLLCKKEFDYHPGSTSQISRHVKNHRIYSL